MGMVIYNGHFVRGSHFFSAPLKGGPHFFFIAISHISGLYKVDEHEEACMTASAEKRDSTTGKI